FFMPNLKFDFPSNTKLESVNLRIKVTTGNKIRAIAKERNIPINEVYATIIEEAIEEYRQLCQVPTAIGEHVPNIILDESPLLSPAKYLIILKILEGTGDYYK